MFELCWSKNDQAKNADKVIIAMFTKLFNINMVANNFWGSFNNSTADFKFVFFESFIFLTSFVLREKKATSEPENKPERKIKKATIINIKKRYVLL